MDSRATLEEIVGRAVERFKDNLVCRRCDDGSLEMKNYHAILRMLFHQTYEVPSTFALAGANCPGHLQSAKYYLLSHADEEKAHWEWMLHDLKTTDYKGPDLRSLLPQPACQAYIAFNYYTAMRTPVARLAIATVLEGIGAAHGKTYGKRLCELLKLSSDQVTFFLRHGETDRSHIVDLWKTIDSCELSHEDWKWMCHAASMASIYYRAMYDEALK
jgi:hypothetical protein